MKLGFIGTGKITSAVVTGICSSSISYNKIIISHRNKSISSTLKKKFKKITISKDNQEIINSCDWIFLSVTPMVGEKIIEALKRIDDVAYVRFASVYREFKDVADFIQELKGLLPKDCLPIEFDSISDKVDDRS